MVRTVTTSLGVLSGNELKSKVYFFPCVPNTIIGSNRSQVVGNGVRVPLDDMMGEFSG